ncbi:MAG TPA: hypothetical protein VF819_10415 [Nitrospira sp.]
MGILPEFAFGVVVIVGTVSIAIAVLTKLGILGRPALTSDNNIAEIRQALDAVQTRLGELEERLDFNERLLTKHRDADRLKAPPK